MMRLNVLAAVAAVGLGASLANATLIYQNGFTGGTGVPSTTPGGGTLGVTNGATYIPGSSFTSTGGISGGAYDNSASTYNSATLSGVASTTSTGGSALSGLPTQDGVNVGSLNSFTISFWVKLPTVANGNGTGQFGNLFVLGASGTTGLANNSIGMEFRNGTLDVRANNQSSATSDGKGAVLGGGWNFIALSYDGTSSLINNSTAQSTATGGLSTQNAQLYEGTDSVSVTRYGIGTAVASGGFSTNTGTLQLGNAAVLFLLNNIAAQNRGVGGVIDDFRIYDTVLSASDVEAARAAVAPTPEPAALALASVGGTMLLRRRRAL